MTAGATVQDAKVEAPATGDGEPPAVAPAAAICPIGTTITQMVGATQARSDDRDGGNEGATAITGPRADRAAAAATLAPIKGI